MSGDPDIYALERQLAVLEERMNTKHAEYESAAERVRADIAQLLAQALERDSTARWWQTAIILAGIGVAVAFLGVWLQG